MKLKLIVLAVAISAGGVAYWTHSSRQGDKGASSQMAARAKRPTSVLLSEVRADSVSIRLSATGTVSAIDRVELRPQATGQIARIMVREGQQVQPGQVLVELDAAAERAQLARAQAVLQADQAQLAIARRDLARSQTLTQQGFISASALDTVQGRVDTLAANLAADHAQVEAARVAVGLKTLRATVAGRVGPISLSPGALVTASMAQPLLTITRLSPLVVDFNLSGQQLGALSVLEKKDAVPVYAQSADDGVCHQGKLSFVDSVIDSGSGNVLLKAQFDNADERLRPGQFVRVTLEAGRYRQALSIPETALLNGPDGAFAYSVDSQMKAVRQPLTLLAVQDGMAVVKGLQAGMRVISTGGQNVRPGEVVALGGKRPGDKNAADKGAAGKGGKPDQAGVAKDASAPYARVPKADTQRMSCPPDAKVGRKSRQASGTEHTS